jgi:hypothetical protein
LAWRERSFLGLGKTGRSNRLLLAVIEQPASADVNSQSATAGEVLFV